MINANRYIFGKKYSNLDSDAQAFITATGITDLLIINAINQLVLDLKSNGLWAKNKAIYPFVGGTAFTHKFNLKDPRDLDIAYRLDFVSVWSHTVNGVNGNGTTAYANTFFTPSTGLNMTSGGLFIYSRTNNANSYYDIGASNDTGAVTNTTSLICRYEGDLAYGNYGNGSYAVKVDSKDGRGGFMVNRNDGTNTTLWRNGIKLKTVAEDVNLTNRPLYIGAINAGGVVRFPSTKQYAFASIRDGLTDAESLIEYNIVQTFQTALSRQV